MTIIGNGSVNLEPDPPSYYGTNDTLTAIPDSGYQFINWSGDLTGSENPAVLLMDYDKNVTATFTPLGIAETSDHVATDFMSISPNPFSKQTQIRCKIHDTGCRIQDVKLRVYDISGRVVKSFRPMPNALGSVQMSWDGTDAQGKEIPCGIYFIKSENEEHDLIKKAILLR